MFFFVSSCCCIIKNVSFYLFFSCFDLEEGLLICNSKMNNFFFLQNNHSTICSVGEEIFLRIIIFFILLGRLLIMNLKFSHSRSYYLVSRSSSSRENSNFHIHSLHFKLAGWIVHVVSFFFLYRSKLKFCKAKVVSHLVYLDDFF